MTLKPNERSQNKNPGIWYLELEVCKMISKLSYTICLI